MNKKTNNPLLDMLLRKKAQQAQQTHNFNPAQQKNMKGQVNNSGPKVMRKQGRGS